MTGSKLLLRLSLVLLLTFSLIPSAQAQQLDQLRRLLKASKPDGEKSEVMVPMRDGVRLATDVYLPEGDGPFPVILTRTPYGKFRVDMGSGKMNFLANGYARVSQDCRGRYKSEGAFGAFDHEGQDGYDTVEWIAKQPWCNGKVGMFGVSAMGITSNFATMLAPPHLECTFVAVAHGCDYRYASHPGGLFLQDLNERWFKALGEPLPEGPRPRIQDYDERFRSRDMKTNHGSVRIPTYNVAGWYDIFVESGLENYTLLQNHAREGALGNQRIVIGPFGHGPLASRIKYPANASRPDFKPVIRWFDRWLKDEENGIDEEPSVRYFLMGDPFDEDAPGNEWRTCDNWPPPSTTTSYYLTEGGTLSTDEPDSVGRDAYRYDPNDPVPTVGGNNLFLPRGPKDQREVADRPDVLVYTSEPLEDPLEIVGRVEVELFVSTDVDDTDFIVKLVDVYPDGMQALVLDQGLRLRYRQGLDDPRRAEDDEVYPLRFSLWSTALVFGEGHRIGVHVTSSNSPRFEAHSNTWEPIDSYEDAVIANNVIYRGAGRASRVLLPVTKVYDGSPTASASGAE